MSETWSDIEGYSGYEVSNLGNVRNKKSKRILRQHNRGDGYFSVLLYNTPVKRVSVHRLVAESFIPNPNVLPQVNHKNGDKKDNRVENLEWCDGSYNQRHRRDVLKKGNRRVRCLETGIEFDSIKLAAECTGSHIPDIVRACKNGSLARGFHWKYVKEE